MSLHFSFAQGFVRPILSDDLAFDVQEGRHAVIDTANNGRYCFFLFAYYSGNFVSNTCCLTTDRHWILTGANMV